MLPGEIVVEFDPGISAPERVPLLVLLALLLSFVLIRISTRLMRSPKVPWWPGSVTTGDLHVHHLVFGIVLLLLAGFLAFALPPESPWIELLAVAFGIGAGLTLDEFALWLHLEDVYWAEEGRRSVDAVVIAAVFAGLVITASPYEFSEGGPLVFLVVFVFGKLLISAVAIVKGKYVFGLIGFFIPDVAEVGAIRLARPGSPWARRRYGDGSEKLATAEAREAKWSRRRERWRDLVGGAPTPEPSPVPVEREREGPPAQ